MRPEWDAVVVGAGPAGALAARELGLRGLSVLLAERKPFPRAKVCGGCLNAHGVASLEAAGLGSLLEESEAPGLRAIQLHAGRAELRLPLSGGRAVERSQLDAALLREAVAAGVRLAPEHRVISSEAGPSGRRIRLRSPQGELETSAAVLIAADGLGGATLAGESLTPRHSRVGAGAIYETGVGGYEPGLIHMAVGRGGYVGLVRLAGGRLNVAAAFDAASLSADGDLASAANRILTSAQLPPLPSEPCVAWTGTPPLTRRPRRPAAERLFAIGDASGYVEPFTGEGMAWALADALAVAPVAEEAAARWQPELASRWSLRHRARTRSSRWRCRAIALVLRQPRTCEALLRCSGTLPSLGRVLARRIHGSEVRA